MKYDKERLNGLAKRFDSTLLRPYAARKDFESFCRSCRAYGFRMAAVNPAATPLCKRLLEGSGVRVGAAIGFPLGQTFLEVKLFEAEQALRAGADDIDYVVSLTAVKDGDFNAVEREMDTLVSLCRRAGVVSKVIFENCYLTQEEIVRLAEIAARVGPDFIKTSTGFGQGGAKPEDVRLMKSVVGDRVKIKASGGISTLEQCVSLLQAGAECLGSSHCEAIMEECERVLQEG